MEFHLAVIFLVMPIMACTAQFGWLRERQFQQPFNNNPLAPQKQSTFKFLYPSTTPSPFNKNPGPKARRDFNDGVDAGFMGGGSWYDVPSGGAKGGSDTGNGVADPAVTNGDTSTNVETWSFWDFDLGGDNDYAGGQSTNGDFGGTGGRVGGRGGGTNMGGRGGMGGAGGGFVGSEDGMQRLKGASAGSIAGIVVGVIILICVVGGGLFFLMRGIHRNALYGSEALTP